MERLILGTHHIALKATGVELYEKTIQFYHEVLGLPILRSWGTGTGQGAMLDTGDSLMEITANGDGTTGLGSIPHFALRTGSVDRVTEVVRAAGAPIIVEPRSLTLATQPPFAIRISFCIGPCGEEIEFFELLGEEAK